MLIKIKKEGQSRYSIRFAVVSIFVFATGLTAALGIFLHWYFSHSTVVAAALNEYQFTASRTGEHLRAVDRSATQLTTMLAQYPGLTDGNRITPAARRLFVRAMQNEPIYYAIYIGFPNGDFYELVNLQSSPAVRRQLKAVESDRWVVIRVSGEGDRQRFYDYYDAAFNLRLTRAEPSEYRADQRIWYSGARPGHVHKTVPYIFQHLQAPGQTFSSVIENTEAVLAVDIALSSLSGYLNNIHLSHPSEIYLFQSSGEVLASNQYADQSVEDLPVQALELTEEQRQYLDGVGKVRFSNETNWAPIDFAIMGEPQGYTVDLIGILADMLGMEIEFVNGYSWADLLQKFRNDEFEVLQPVFPNEEHRRSGNLSLPILELPYAVATASGQSHISHIQQLTGQTVAIPSGWSIIPVIRRSYPGITVQEVPSTRHALQAVADGAVFATLDSAAILRYAADIFFIDGLQFHDIAPDDTAGLPNTVHFLVSKEHPRLLDLLNLALESLPTEHKQRLETKWLGDGEANTLPTSKPVVPHVELIQHAQNLRKQNRIETIENANCDCFSFVTAVDNNQKGTEFLAVVTPRNLVLAPALSEVRLSLLLTLACFMCLFPLCWWFASPIVRPIKRLSVENEKIKNRQYDEVEQCDSRIIEVHELSSSIVKMAAAIKKHEREQQDLMDSFIKLIAQAIDDKSPYTGAHCARVPELALMLARAANRSDTPPFDGFRFHSEQQWREFSIGAWLHDCGKITTPEHIVDKGTKLETIYNRIHEIRTRFEVLRRDAHIRCLQETIEDPENQTQYEYEFRQTCRRLEESYAFIAQINIGGESLADEDIERLHQLSSITWTRHFSNRLGLSPVEELRYQGKPESLPVIEPLLADRPEHIIPRCARKGLDPALNIRMDIPEHLYNLGEIYNLSIRRGTLTAEDRFKINEHMISTVKMLESLSFPKELARVPKYASTHHETLTGTGYPRRLTAEDLDIPDRVLAIADIFEALTAADRPYKKAKRVSEAIDIIYNLVQGGKLCADTFRLFLSSGVYLDYARQYLSPEQIDDVDLGYYLNT